MRLLKQSSTAQPLPFFMADSADGKTGKTGLAPTVTIRKVGGSFATPAGAVTEIANGWYEVAGNATDTNTLGPLLLHASATGADPADREFEVVAFDPQIAFTGTATAGSSGGLLIAGSNASTTFSALTVTNATNLSGAVTFGSTFTISGNSTLNAVSTGTLTLTALTVSGAAAFTGALTALNSGNKIVGVFSEFSIHSGTAQAGGASTITLAAGASSTDNFYRYRLVIITGGTGAGQVGVIASYVGSTRVATMASAWGTAPDNTSTYSIEAVTGAVTQNTSTLLGLP